MLNSRIVSYHINDYFLTYLLTTRKMSNKSSDQSWFTYPRLPRRRGDWTCAAIVHLSTQQ